MNFCTTLSLLLIRHHIQKYINTNNIKIILADIFVEDTAYYYIKPSVISSNCLKLQTETASNIQNRTIE